MDLPQKQNCSIDEIFEESVFANKLFFSSREHSEHLSEKDYIDFNIEESVNNFLNIHEIPLPEPLEPDECHSIRVQQAFDDTNHLDDLSDDYLNPSAPQQSPPSQHISLIQLDSGREKGEEEEELSCEKLEQILAYHREIIVYLVGHSNQGQDQSRQFSKRFSNEGKNQVVKDLVSKFGKLKKTKEELIKYCMRKAFKFILELPKNKHLLEVSKQQKFSFSKCKNRFLKRISEEKSMNNKFLQQIFTQKDFSDDYLLFLRYFQHIMEEDNEKKVKYLAEMLTVNIEGKVKSVEMVRRLPWTQTILEKVGKISRELLKYSGPK